VPPQPVARGAQAVFAVATHGHFGPGSDAMLADPAIDRIVVSESVPTASATAGQSERIEIFSVALLIGETIHRLHTGSPLRDATSVEAWHDLHQVAPRCWLAAPPGPGEAPAAPARMPLARGSLPRQTASRRIATTRLAAGP